MSDLADQKCVPCEGGVDPITPLRAQEYLKQLHPDWKLIEGNLPAGEAGKITRRFKFKNYKQAWNFVNKVSKIAEGESHHPDISFGWGYAQITSYTHAINGLFENDFILAAKIDRLRNS
ncbi:MAG: 4a-hydroxytetrahydrobiopterin dehydratase [bacterium]|nr:4a-hydroxytetrahydrobiopterin dehydratase [bacterium]